MDPIAIVEKLFDVAVLIKDHLEKVEYNKDQCSLLQKHIDIVLKPAEKFKQKAQMNEGLKKFVDEMEDIMNKTKELFAKMSKKKGIKEKLTRIIKAGSDEAAIQNLRERLKLLSEAASYITLCKLYEKDGIVTVKEVASWATPFDYVCVFVHVTPDGLIIVCGSNKDKEDARQLRAYNQTGEELWHWQCSAEIGQPSDMAMITVEDPNKDTEDFLAIVCEDSGKVMLFDPIERSVHPIPAYTIADPTKGRLRRIARMGKHRMMVSIDPTWAAADCGTNSILKLLRCNKIPFSEIRSIPLPEVIDTHGLTSLSKDELVIGCGRHNDRVHMYDDEGHMRWTINPQRIGSSEVIPEAVCKVGGDICVYDSSETRLIMASSDGYKNKPLLDEDELGEQVYGLMWDGMSRRIAVLHEKSNRRKITMYGIDN